MTDAPLTGRRKAPVNPNLRLLKAIVAMAAIGTAAYYAFIGLETANCAAAGREIRVIDGNRYCYVDYSNWQPGQAPDQK